MPSIRWRTLTDICGSTTASVASSTQSMKIPRDTFIRRLFLRQYVNYTANTTTPTLADSNPMGNITNIKLVAGGNDTLCDTAFSDLFYRTTYMYGTEIDRVAESTTTSATAQVAQSVATIDFALMPKYAYDFSALLPAHLLPSLWLYASFGADTTMGTVTTTNYAYVKPTLEEVILSPAEQQALFGSKLEKLMKPYYAQNTKTIDAAYSDFQFNWDLPVGNILQNMLIRCTNNTARSDAECTRYKIKKLGPTAFDIYETDWRDSQSVDVAEYSLDADMTETNATAPRYLGITMYDAGTTQFSNIAGQMVGGLDLRGLKSGDVQFQATTGAPTATANFKFLTKEIRGWF